MIRLILLSIITGVSLGFAFAVGFKITEAIINFFKKRYG